MNYKKLNLSLGWLVFLIATIVYFITLEDTVSLWDCGEYITAANKLEVGHPPGAPLFMLLGRLFTFFAEPENVALWINRMSALSSSFTILFMFWSITMFAKKMAFKDKRELSKGQIIAILGSGVVGALAYTFTESFWFSAVEGEVYAMSSLFTAAIFWALLKWDEESTAIKHGELSSKLRPMRWMVLIMFLFGLAIGVHLLGLLVLPCIAYVILFNYQKTISVKSFFVTGIIGVFALAFVQNGIIPGTIALASSMEIFFVNSLGMPFTSGAVAFFIILISLLVLGLMYTRKKGLKFVNTAILGLIVLFIGYGSFATIVIRSNADTPLDENNPENLVTLHAYLKREQYGSWPIGYGPYWNSKKSEDQASYGDRSAFYLKRWVVLNGDKEVKSFREEAPAKAYADKLTGSKISIKQKYFETNKATRKSQVPTYAQNTILPRMYWNADANRISGYKKWSGYDVEWLKKKVDAINKDNSISRRDRKNKIAILKAKYEGSGAENPMLGMADPIPTFSNNMQYMIDYQFGWMYLRYFMWNFAGRQNDIQGHGGEMRGNYKSGFNFIDEDRLGAMGENEFWASKDNPSNNSFYFIPLILALIGMFFHFLKAPKDAFVVTLLFLFTGFAIVLYLNQKPFEPRERDYAYAASFYAFAFWIGLGVYGLYEAFRSFSMDDAKKLGISAAGLLMLCLFGSTFTDTSTPLLSGLVVVGIAVGAILLMVGLKKVIDSKISGAVVATALGIIAPVLLANQGWDDHDRSERTGAEDLAYNYLTGCANNSILYTNGDNDTFPLWYMQEVEEFKTDVRVCNLSLMQTDWYTEQMMMQAYESTPLPIKFREDQILMNAGSTDYVLFGDYLANMATQNPEGVEKVISSKIKHNKSAFLSAVKNARRILSISLNQLTVNEKSKNVNKVRAAKPVIISQLNDPNIEANYEEYAKTDRYIKQIFKLVKSRELEGSQQIYDGMNQLVGSWTSTWDFLPIAEAMEFVRDDKNMLDNYSRKLRFFPSRGFIIPVNKENAVKSGIISKEDVADCMDEIRIEFRPSRYLRESEVGGLSREEVMMLDVLANNDWERGIYFSSAGGSTLAKALLEKGRLHTVGMNSLFSPLKPGKAEEHARKVTYDNLINNYNYGNVSKEGTLADYYVRRHTSQYRNNFAELAMNFVQSNAVAENNISRNNGFIEQLKQQSAGDTRIDSITQANATINAEIAENKEKIVALINKSTSELPISNVLDMGEPRDNGRPIIRGVQNNFTDGTTPNYIIALYSADAMEEADKLADEYISQLETYINYFGNSNGVVAYKNKNDFVAFATNFFRTMSIINESCENNELLNRVNGLEAKLSLEVVPHIISDLEAELLGEDKRGRAVFMDQEAQTFNQIYTTLKGQFIQE